jgi:hypothetical protein
MQEFVSMDFRDNGIAVRKEELNDEAAAPDRLGCVGATNIKGKRKRIEGMGDG